jgi:hypothetical protein
MPTAVIVIRGDRDAQDIVYLKGNGFFDKKTQAALSGPDTDLIGAFGYSGILHRASRDSFLYLRGTVSGVPEPAKENHEYPRHIMLLSRFRRLFNERRKNNCRGSGRAV